jgi:hypothetical protein
MVTVRAPSVTTICTLADPRMWPASMNLMVIPSAIVFTWLTRRLQQHGNDHDQGQKHDRSDLHANTFSSAEVEHER